MYTKIFLTETNDKMFWYKESYLLGQFEKWDFVKDTGGLITIGNQKRENPIKLVFKNKGTYRLTFNIIPYFADKLSDQIYTIECGGKKNKFYTIGNHMGTLNVFPPYTSDKFGFNFSSIVEANENETSTISVIGHNCWNMSTKSGLYGDPEEIWSSISLEFIANTVSEQKKEEAIIVKEDTKLQMNRRYLVYALYAKILQLDLPDEMEVGEWIEIKNMEFGNFRVNSNKSDIVMNGKTTRAKNGYIQSIKRGDFVRLECLEKSPERTIVTDTNTIGTFTIL